MKVMRHLAYWELVREEIATVIEESMPPVDLTGEITWEKSWDQARREAIERLYVLGTFQDL